MTDQQRLVAFLRSFDNGGDLVTLTATRDDPTAHNGAFDCEELLAEQGHAEDGSWMFWDRMSTIHGFTNGTLTGEVTIWWRGDKERCRALLSRLPAPYELGFDEEQDAFVVTKPLADGDLDFPDPADEAAVLLRIGRLEQDWGDPQVAEWRDRVLTDGSTKARLAVLGRHSPVSEPARTAVISDLKALSKGNVSGQLETLLRGLDLADDPRLDETVDALLAMRGWAPRTAAVPYLLRRRDATSEQTLRKLLATKGRPDTFEPVIGGVSTLVHLIAIRDGRDPGEIASELADDERLSAGSRATALEQVATRPAIGPDHRSLLTEWAGAATDCELSFDPGDFAAHSSGDTLTSALRIRWSGERADVERAVEDLPGELAAYWCGPGGAALEVEPHWDDLEP